MNNVQEIKNEMQYWFGFDLTDEQIYEFLSTHPNIQYFDTDERSMFADYLANKITGMRWPINMDPKEYKDTFYSALQSNAKKFGYILS